MLTDFMGNEIKVGSMVAYPNKTGSSSAYMTVAKVLEVVTKKRYEWDDVERTSLKVQRVATSGFSKPEEGDRPVTLTNLGAVLVLNSSQ